MADPSPLDFSGFSNTPFDRLKLKHKLAAAMLQGAGDTSPVHSKWEALNRVISPLLGALLENNASKEGGALSAAAGPELSSLANSDNPMAAALASKNPLIQAMLPQLAQMQLEQKMHARGVGADTAAQGQARLGFEPQLAGATSQAELQQRAKYEPQIAGGIASAQVPAAVETARQTLPFKVQELQAGQAPEYANLAERKREFDLTPKVDLTGGFGGNFGAATDTPPLITTKADFAKLPSGALYREADGNTYRKP